MTMDRIDVALIGAGRMGSIHGPNAGRHPGLRLKYVIDPRPEAAAAVGAPFGATTVTLDEALADSSIGGVLICSSTDQHLEHALAAVAAGKAVFCEKPLDLDLAKVVAAAPQLADARLVLAFNRRFDPHFAALKARVDAGAVGRLESLHLVNHDPASPPPGFIPTSGGLFKDFTIHDLDLARWLLGEEIAEVYAAASCLVDPEIGRLGDVDTARTVLKTTSGRLCVISNTRRSGYGYDQRIEAFGSSGHDHGRQCRARHRPHPDRGGRKRGPDPQRFPVAVRRSLSRGNGSLRRGRPRPGRSAGRLRGWRGCPGAGRGLRSVRPNGRCRQTRRTVPCIRSP
jgi:myo-inositol 2-dehydrogenase/D-chiro-inositol 1-dehydrogenase